MKNKVFLLCSAGLLALTALTACTSAVSNINHVSASQIARPAFMVDRTIEAGAYPLYAWERMHERRAPATLYIGGGDEVNPVGLHLASRDRAENLVYLAGACDYQTGSAENCAPETFQPGSADVLASYNSALDEIKKRYSITGFHVVGYDEGGNIAALLASERPDILSLRTVAAQLAPQSGLSAVAVAPQLSRLGQHHFIGAADDVVKPDTYHFYRQAMGASDCVHYTLVQDADHTRGWVEEWPTLLTYPNECTIQLQEYEPQPFPPAEDRSLSK